MKIAILTGEVSGDNYAALLIKNLKEVIGEVEIFCTGGEKVRQEKIEVIEGMPSGYMGYSSIILKIPAYLRFLNKLVEEIKERKPDLVIFVDNPGFNLKVAEKLNKKFFSIYYIPPKVWAHGYKRIKKIRKYCDFVIPIFPFEEQLYKKEQIPCKFFGHPVIDLIRCEKKENVEKNKTLGILPGSRVQEVVYILPEMLKVVKKIKKVLNFDILISATDDNIEKIIKEMVKKEKIKAEILKYSPYPVIERADVILSTSGTVNLEVSLCLKPLIVFYKTSFINYMAARFMVKLDIISPVNLFIGKKVVPEYIQKFPTEKVKEDIIELFERGPLYREEIKEFEKLKEKIGEKGVSRKIAEFIKEGISKGGY